MFPQPPPPFDGLSHGSPKNRPQATRDQELVASIPQHAAARVTPETYLIKKEAAADGPVEPPAEEPEAGVTRAVVHAAPRPQAFDIPSGPAAGGWSRTVSATATAATAASAWRKEKST